jgi:hypothetical protein
VSITILSATYGVNCPQNLTNNVLDSLKRNCNGKIECTFGNQNLEGMSSAWDPTDKFRTKTCRKGFEITYKCQNSGQVLSIVAGEEAAYRAVPFGCVESLPREEAIPYVTRIDVPSTHDRQHFP